MPPCATALAANPARSRKSVAIRSSTACPVCTIWPGRCLEECGKAEHGWLDEGDGGSCAGFKVSGGAGKVCADVRWLAGVLVQLQGKTSLLLT